MALSLNHIISDIRNIATSGSNSVEFKIEDSQIAFWINECRATLISQAIAKNQDISDTWVQKIGCLEMEHVIDSDCCLVDSSCYVYRSVEELPDSIETFGDNFIIRVTMPSGEIISKSNPFNSIYSKYNKYTGTKPEWYIKNKHLYVIHKDSLKYVTVYIIAEDPTELGAFRDCSDTECFSYETDYPCSLKMASQITDIVVRTKVYPFLQLPADNKNDAANTPESPLPKKI